MLPIGYQITLRRLEKGWTQKELAQKAGIAQPNLSNIEKGKQDLTVTTLRKIAHGLGAQLSEFFAGEAPQKSPQLSRRVIEKIARAVAKGGVSLTQKERQVAAWLSDVLPERKRVPVKKMHQSWMELKRRFHSAQINALYERIREMKRIP